MNLIVAVTAASGALYARLLLERLLECPQTERIALIRSRHAQAVAEYEGVTLPRDPRIEEYENDDLFAPAASGSARYEAMAVIPCSAGTVGRLAAGVSHTLIERAADVMLKERRRLVLVVRESPLSLLHLRNMAALTECGAVILPACPAFYARHATIEALCTSVVERTLAQLGVASPAFEWGKNGG